MAHGGKVFERARARDLRAAGWTMPEIAAELRVARSSVSLWCRDVPYTPRRPRPTPGVHPFHLRRLDELETFRRESVDAIGRLSERDLTLYVLGLYHGEGAKTDRSLRLANTSPQILVAFVTWLRRTFDLDEQRLRVRVYLHEGRDLEVAEHFWSEYLSIPRSQFQRAQRVEARRMGAGKHPFGCATVIYSDASIHRRVMASIAAISSAIANPG